MKTKKKFNIRALARETGADRASIKKWIGTTTDHEEALVIVREHQAAAKIVPDDQIDAATGLTWFHAKLREDTLKKRRLREEAEAIQNKTWITVADHHEILSAVMNRLELLPNLAQSRLGLSPEQATGLQRLIDDARKEAADQIRASLDKEGGNQ